MSTAISFRFIAGRYHATPWRAHVNEAAVEWPPAPWRVLRSLIAVWHRKVDPAEITEDQLEVLVNALSGCHPHFALPCAVHSHVRHYMPTHKGKEVKSTLVFDAFAAVAPADQLIMVWPGDALGEEPRAHLALLLSRLGYLGRAESWVEARLIDEPVGEPNCVPLHVAGAESNEAEDGELVSIPVPTSPEDYLEWRNEQVSELGLDSGRLGVQQKRLLRTLPERLIDALRLDTGDVRAEGWNRHPGLNYVDYLRPADSIGIQARRITRTIEHEPGTTVRFILTGKPLPRVEDAIKIGEVVRAAAIHRADAISGDDGPVPPVLSGHAMGSDNRHEHAFYLPEDADDDGRIDHVIVHAGKGFDSVALAALASLNRIWLDGGQEWGLIFERYGYVTDFASHPYLRSARRWTSMTPYLHPWHRKKKFGVEEQIRRECRERGLPEPEVLSVESVRVHERERRPVHFFRFRTRNRRRGAQPDVRGSFWQLTFPHQVRGPVALGFGCHFGLGMFKAETE